MMKNTVSILALGVCLALASCGQKTEAPKELESTIRDLCIENANYYNENGKLVLTDIAVDNGVIKNYFADGLGDLCSDPGIKYKKIIDLKGAYLYPGFVDSHAHLLGIGLREMTLNLEGTASIKTLQKTLAAEVAKTPKGETVYGRGWIETHWPEDRFPTRQDLDAVSPDNPVLLQRSDGHAMVINSAALKVAGITKDTKPPFGGDILHDAEGEPTGMLIDHAMGLVKDLMPTLTPARNEAAYIKASEIYA
ncbi:MAG: amidohydrolase family protein, partial [Robiginitomaculum sp.]|nr:amidohydrolase family protein [Robiginitomaculum sp.]